MTATLIAAAALAVALVALLRDRHEHLQRQARDDQGLEFESRPAPDVLKIGDGPEVRKYVVLLRAVGPGARHNVQTHIWTGDHIEGKWKSTTERTARFDSTSPTLGVELQMPVADAERTWFGISHVTASRTWPFGRPHMQSQYVRSLIGNRREDRRIQVWKWHRIPRLRRWWQARRWLSFVGGGQPRPLGHWKDMPLRELLPKQGPLRDGVDDADVPG